MTTALKGTGALVGVAVRRDRLQLGIWLVGLAALMAAFAGVMHTVFDTQQEVDQAVSTLAANPVVRAFGLASGASTGALVMLRVLALFTIVVGLMSAMAVIRHTRQNEETRRAELIGSTVVGRHAALAAALIVVAGANLLLAVLVAVSLVATGLGVHGALAAGAALGASGIAFAGVAAIAAQIASDSRGATGLATVAIGVAFLLSATGNVLGSVDDSGFTVQPAWLAWLSPVGWAQLMRPFGGEYWAVLGLFALWFLATTAIAVVLERRRDVGRGMIPERRGPPVAARSLLSPLGLAWRLQRGMLIAWAIGVAVFGSVFGAVANAFEGIVEDVSEAAEFFARAGGTEELTDAFFATIIGLMGVTIAVYTIQTLLRMRSEEVEGLLEPVLATSVGRVRWMVGHVTIAMLGTLLLLLVTGASAGVFSGFAVNDVPGQTLEITAAALVQAPAVLLIAGIVILCIGWRPALAPGVAWSVFTVALVAGPMIGALLDLPGWVLDLSPFGHLPQMPAESFALWSVLVLLVLALTLAAAGMAAFRRRDLQLQAGGGESGRARSGRDPQATPGPEPAA